MPDILAKEKSEIRALAQRYAQSLWLLPFDKGIVAYVKTEKELFIHPARWRYCFKCGMILKSSLSKKTEPEDETTNHSCVLEFEDVPLLIKTSWYQLKKFFLEDKHHNGILGDIGLPALPKPVIVKTDDKEVLPVTESIDALTEESS